jgi:hypothetical protein
MQDEDMNTANLEETFPDLVITNVTYCGYWNRDGQPKEFLVPHRVYGRGEDRAKTVGDALEILFRQLNHVDGSELISEEQFKGYRSMSVGDEVRFRGLYKIDDTVSRFDKTYRCEGMGWSEVTKAKEEASYRKAARASVEGDLPEPETSREADEMDRYGI